MSADSKTEHLLAEAKAKWDSLPPAQQAKYLRRKAAELGRAVAELDAEAKKPKQ